MKRDLWSGEERVFAFSRGEGGVLWRGSWKERFWKAQLASELSLRLIWKKS